MNLLENLRRLFIEPIRTYPSVGNPQEETQQSRNPFRPAGSHLAERVAQEVDVELAAREEQARQKAEEERLAAEQKILEEEGAQRKTEEVKRELQETFERLGIMPVLQDLKDNIWQGGTILKPQVLAESYRGWINTRLEFSYPTATRGYWHNPGSGAMGAGYGESRGGSGYNPKIYIGVKSLDIAVQLRRDSKPNAQLLLWCNKKPKPFEYFTAAIKIPIGEDEKAMEQLRIFIVNDSKQRILNGLLPVSKAVAEGQDAIRDVRTFVAEHKYTLIDETRR